MENNLLTLDILHKKMLSLDKTPEKELTYTKRYLKTMIEEQFQDTAHFTSQERKIDVLCFKDLTASIIREHLNDNGEDQKTKIISSAVKLIMNDISLANLYKSSYPSIYDLTTPEKQLELVPESLKLLLKPLLKKDHRVAFWGQSIIKSSRPRSGVLPSTLAFGLQLEHRFGSRWLIDKMHSLGFCESYQEISDYKYAHITGNTDVLRKTHENLETIIEEDEIEDDDLVDEELASLEDNDEQIIHKSHSLTNSYDGTQYVGDNIDLNIVSVNGNTPFHAMGLIKIFKYSSLITDSFLNKSITRQRLSPVEKAMVLKAGDIALRKCPDPRKSGINSSKLIPMTELIQSVSCVPAELGNNDMIWAAGWIVKNHYPEFQHVNWNGWMKNANKGNNKEPHYISYQPIIDGDPNDYSTIYTTLLECIEKEQPHLPVITFDLPLWLKSVDIIESKKLSIIPRLGGFHLLKSFLGTFSVIFADCGLRDIIQLIYDGDIVADSILNGNSYDKAIRAHFLIDAAIIQHLVSNSFTEEEVFSMKNVVETVNKIEDGVNDVDFPIVEAIKTKIRDIFIQCKNSGRTAALWSLYHDMVDTIKIFIRAERLADFSLHLSCITNRMLDPFASAGHHHYAKAARLYVQRMLAYEKGSIEEKAVIANFKEDGSHVVRYSNHKWSGIWTDLCIEQTLMRTSKSNGGLSGGRFRNGDSAHRCWVQTLSHLSMINSLMQTEDTSSTSRVKHRDLLKSQRFLDEKAVNAVRKWLDEMAPFSSEGHPNMLVSFSTGFVSNLGDGINPERAINIGRELQVQLDNMPPSTKLPTTAKVKSLAFLRKNMKEGDSTHSVNALMYFNRLIIFAQRELNFEICLGEYELTPLPLSLFSQKNQLMHQANKASFAQNCLKAKVGSIENRQIVHNYIIDGGWLLRQTKWDKSMTWSDILQQYVNFVKAQGYHAQSLLVVFDGYENSTKDHTHRRRQKMYCNDMRICKDQLPFTTKERFIANSKNKSELILAFSEELRTSNIGVINCRDDADTTIVAECLKHAMKVNVECRGEDADLLILLVHHFNPEKHKSIVMATANGSFSIKKIQESLSDDEERCLLFCYSFFGCDAVSALYGIGKETVYRRICSQPSLRKHLDVFYCENSNRDEIVDAGLAILQFTYRSPTVPLSIQRVSCYSKQSKAGVLRPESLPPTVGAAKQHSLRAYLQIQDWILLKTMSRDPTKYGWYVTSAGTYEPILTDNPIAPKNLVKLVSCNCGGDCSTKRCYCRKNNVKCISACGSCLEKQCKNIDSELTDKVQC